MRQLKTEIMQMPNLSKFTNWEDIFREVAPRLGSMDDIVEVKITASSLQITKLEEESHG